MGTAELMWGYIGHQPIRSTSRTEQQQLQLTGESARIFRSLENGKKYNQKLLFSFKDFQQNRNFIDMMNGKEISLALTPCLKVECAVWRDGECIHIRKAGR
jgi:hypothetical protein